jgi:hypothetical protein
LFFLDDCCWRPRHERQLLLAVSVLAVSVHQSLKLA